MADLPPSYQQATGSSTASQRLQVPGGGRSGIPLPHRRSMQDEGRQLPDGWIRQFDPKSEHQFFVDTRSSPPRSIWHHPYDDETFLKSLSSEERERIEELQRQPPSREDIIHGESDIEDQHASPHLPPRPSSSGQGSSSGKGANKWGRKLKDKMTGTTHEQRALERQRRDEQEQEMYRRHLHIRQAMARAMETGTPQFLGKDPEGHDVYIEPPRGGPWDQNGRFYNPHTAGPYQQLPPNSRLIPYPVPRGPYGRPYPYGGYGYGYGGMGMGLPIMGGLLGGAMLGGLLF